MIDTIFYFCKTDDQYQAERSAGLISDRTIVFVEDVREIYLNGRAYGKTSTNGFITDDEFDGWKGDVDDKLDDLKDKLDKDLKDTESDIKDRLDDLKNLYDDILDRLKQSEEELEDIHDNIKDVVESTIKEDWETFQGLINGEIEKAIADLESDVVRVFRAFVSEDNTSATWADFILAAGQIRNSVAKIAQLEGDYNNLNGLYVALNSTLEQYISQNDEAIAALRTQYAVIDEYGNTIKWLTSGFETISGQYDALAAMYAATEELIAAVRTYVDDEIAKAEMSSATVGWKVDKYPNVESLPEEYQKVIPINLSSSNAQQLYEYEQLHGYVHGVYSGSEITEIFGLTLNTDAESFLYRRTEGVLEYILFEKQYISFANVETRSYSEGALAAISAKFDNNLATIQATADELSSQVAALVGAGEGYIITVRMLGVEDSDYISFPEDVLEKLNAYRQENPEFLTGGTYTVTINLLLEIFGRSSFRGDISYTYTYTYNMMVTKVIVTFEHTLLSMADLLLSAFTDEALAALDAKYGLNFASIESRVNSNTSAINALAEYKKQDGSSNYAWVFAEAALDSAMVGLLAKDTESGAKSSITAMVEDGVSSVTISADLIRLDGTTYADTIFVTELFAKALKADAIVANAAHIAGFDIEETGLTKTLTYQDNVGSSGATRNHSVNISMSPETGYTISDNYITADDSRSEQLDKININQSGITISNRNDSTENKLIEKVKLNIDGSGHLANGNIKWDTAGNLTMNGIIKADQFFTKTIYLEPNDGSYHLNFNDSGTFYVIEAVVPGHPENINVVLPSTSGQESGRVNPYTNIEYQFLAFENTGMSYPAANLTIGASGNERIYILAGGGNGANTSTVGNIKVNKNSIVTIKRIGDMWFVVSGGASIVN